MNIVPSGFAISRFSLKPDIDIQGAHFDFKPDIRAGANIYLRLMSMYVSGDRLIGVYQDGTSSDVGSIDDLPVTVIYQTSGVNFSVDGETLVMTSTE